jgi:hypothetical protein
MRTINAEDYLDHRNSALWEDLNAHFNISLAANESNYGIYTKSRDAVIYVPNQLPCKDSFTHELLHLLLDKKEIYITGSLIHDFANPVFEGTFRDDLAEHVGNCLNHVKMLPLYLELGFKRENFIADYHQRKFIDEEAALSQFILPTPGHLWKTAANLSVAKYFAAKACPNPAFDYTPQLAILEEAEPILYELLDTFWEKWKMFDIDNNDPISNNYHLLSYDFYVDLHSWILERKKAGFI